MERRELVAALRAASGPDRALDWRVYAAAVNRSAASRLGGPDMWAPRDLEDAEFACYADARNIPRYTTNLAGAVWLVELTDAAVRDGGRPIGCHEDGREP